MKRLVIVGGGFCGTMVFWNLMQHSDLPALEISIYDEHGRFGRGVAYSTPYDEHLLNVPASGMSAVPHDPDDFLRWIGGDADRARFYPRRLYGEYIAHYFDMAMTMAQEKGCRVTLIGEKFPGTADAGNLVVYATGTSSPVWPGGGASDSTRLVPGPYLAGITIPEPCHTIVILGTGLSAVDGLMTLRRLAYTGEVICVSRHGLWPVAHGPKDKPWHWRKYIDALRPHSNRIWRSLPARVRSWCLKRITFWNVIRHRMPPDCAAAVREMIVKGQLRVIPGTIRSVSQHGHQVQVSLASGRNIGCDMAINCLGYIPYTKQSAPGFRIAPGEWTLGAPLFGSLIETTAVPELRVQAYDVASDMARTMTG